MSEEKKYTNNEELCEGITKITEEDLEQVTGGVIGVGKAIEFKAKVGMQIYLPEL